MVVYWSGWMGDGEPGERDDGVSQLSDGDTTRMAHCCRVGFVGLM